MLSNWKLRTRNLPKVSVPINKILSLLFCFFFCFSVEAQQALPSEIIKEDYQVNSASSPVILQASESIILKPNSQITVGSDFLALILSDPYLNLHLSNNKNYVFTRKYQVALTDSTQIRKNADVMETVSYIDDLGRVSHTIAIKQSPDLRDIVTPSYFDSNGRMSREYLSYPSTGVPGRYQENWESDVTNYYLQKYPDDIQASFVNPYLEKQFEKSNLNRVLKEGMAGFNWRLGGGHEKHYTEKINTVNDEVALFNVSFNGNTETPVLIQQGNYPEGTLFRNIVKNENWKPTDGSLFTTEEYKDKEDRIVLKRNYVLNANKTGLETLDTHYVYDRFGNLTFVIPPKVSVSNGVDADELYTLCYQYVYDYKNRLVEKKIPGKGWEYIIYDELDQPILTQDANLRAVNKWLFTKYDTKGRLVYSGMYIHPETVDRIQMLNYIDNQSLSAFAEQKQTSPVYLAAKDIYYTNVTFPTSNISEIHVVNYYDNYESFDITGFTLPGNVSTNVEDLSTYTQVNVLGTSYWVNTLNGYDEQGRLIWTSESNWYLDTYYENSQTLDFVGKVLKTKETHRKGTNLPIITYHRFQYDHAGRVIATKHQIEGHPEENLALHSYDAIGLLDTKKIGNTVDQPLQEINYNYNVHGWLTNINDIDNLGADLFSFRIAYNDGINPLFNGNISSTSWRTNNIDNTIKTYNYEYDGLDRILKATDDTGKYTVSNITYDAVGNILSLNRMGHTVLQPDASRTEDFGIMDALIYQYDTGNKLQNVQDNGDPDFGFVNGSNLPIEYSYDANGNMISDSNKGIASITYNHLNLPTQVAMPNGTISYIYSATGVKQKKIADNTVESSLTSTEYAGNYIYENGNLKQFSHAEGYVEVDTNGEYLYVYSYLDHLGTVRLTYSDYNGNGSIEPATEILQERNTYPFGLEHKGYNNIQNGVESNYQTYLGQEMNKELGLNWLSFRHRNHDPSIGRFFGVDPITEEYHYISSYQFSSNNPVWKVELEGLEGEETSGIDLIRQGFANIWNAITRGVESTDNGMRRRSAQSRATQFARGGNMVAEGAATKEVGHVVLDAAGTADPTPIVDTVHSLWYLADGEYGNATLTMAGVIPYFGDGFKTLKYAKYSDEAAELVSTGSAKLSNKGILELDFHIPEGMRRQGIGTAMFNHAVETFGNAIQGIKGTWLDGDNLSTFQKVLRETGDMNKAIFSTPTGKWAQKNGFDQAKVTGGHVGENGYEGIEIIFNRSN
ncbi:DUF6443 domain-containing protein [Flavobacteriaceae bacterium M23B6Z8]